PIPAKLARGGVKDMVRISDARMSGTAYGTIVLHVSPEAAVGGPLALVRNGDRIRLSVTDRRPDLPGADRELARRAAPLPRPRPRAVTRSSTWTTCSRPSTAATLTSCEKREPRGQPRGTPDDRRLSASLTRRHRRSRVSGISVTSTPSGRSASAIALAIAAGA